MERHNVPVMQRRNVALGNRYSEDSEKNLQETTTILAKMGILESNEHETNQHEFLRKMRIINLAEQMFRKLNFNYTNALNQLLKAKTPQQIINDLKKVEFVVDPKTGKRTMPENLESLFSPLTKDEIDLAIEKYTPEQLFKKINAIEVLNIGDYMIEGVFDYENPRAQTATYAFIDSNTKLRTYYQDVLKILIVYAGLESDMKVLNEKIRKIQEAKLRELTNEERQKMISDPFFLMSNSLILLLLFFLSNVWLAQCTTTDITIASKPNQNVIEAEKRLLQRVTEKQLEIYKQGKQHRATAPRFLLTFIFMFM